MSQIEVIDTFSLPEGDLFLKECMNFNPWIREYYLKTQNITRLNPDETDRGGWRGYNRVYSKYISQFKFHPIQLLEIGVHAGYGLLSWLRYFKNSTVTGVEYSDTFINLYNQHFINYDEFCRVKLKFFDSTNPENWELYVPLHIKKYDVIIDDGSHLPNDQIKTLKAAWPYLKPGGYYFIEDISTRYTNPTCKEVFKELDLMREDGNYVKIYSHLNISLKRILDNKNLWKNFGFNENTPKDAIDYIAVLQKK